MNKSIHLMYIATITLIVTFITYFVYIKPSETRKQCEHEASSRNDEKYEINNAYRQCLVRNGVEPETLFTNLDEY